MLVWGAGLENDLYVRQTEGYLPTSEVSFVDEIFKANSAILNSLLTLLNERLFDNGNQRLPAPLLCLVGASNELPESEELDALYDRFLIRRSVSQVCRGRKSWLVDMDLSCCDRKPACLPACCRHIKDNGTGELLLKYMGVSYHQSVLSSMDVFWNYMST